MNRFILIIGLIISGQSFGTVFNRLDFIKMEKSDLLNAAINGKIGVCRFSKSSDTYENIYKKSIEYLLAGYCDPEDTILPTIKQVPKEEIQEMTSEKLFATGRKGINGCVIGSNKIYSWGVEEEQLFIATNRQILNGNTNDKDKLIDHLRELLLTDKCLALSQVNPDLSQAKIINVNSNATLTIQCSDETNENCEYYNFKLTKNDKDTILNLHPIHLRSLMNLQFSLQGKHRVSKALYSSGNDIFDTMSDMTDNGGAIAAIALTIVGIPVMGVTFGSMAIAGAAVDLAGFSARGIEEINDLIHKSYLKKVRSGLNALQQNQALELKEKAFNQLVDFFKNS